MLKIPKQLKENLLKGVQGKNLVAGKAEATNQAANPSQASETQSAASQPVSSKSGDNHRSSGLDTSVKVGNITLKNPVMCAAGTAGYGAELGAYFPLESLGALVVKSLLHEPWQGNPAPRVFSTDAGMINSVGLSGPGVAAWAQRYLPDLISQNAPTVVSLWGRSVAEFELAAQKLLPYAEHLTAVELNVSCPNVEDRDSMFAHSPSSTRDAIAATAILSEQGGLDRWAKLSPNIANIVPVAEAAAEAGASAVVVANTMIGLAIDIETRMPRLGKGRGGLSGPAIRPIAVRAVNDVANALPELDVIGCGGIAKGEDAIEFMIAGAKAVQVGTATFANPRAAHTIRAEIERWCLEHGVAEVASLTKTLKARGGTS